MTLSEYAKAFAGRWGTKQAAAPVILPSPIPVHGEPPYSTPRAACVLQSGEQVLRDGAWRTIGRLVCVAGSPSQSLLFMTDGSVCGSRFDYVYPSRDVDEQRLAAKDGAA